MVTKETWKAEGYPVIMHYLNIFNLFCRVFFLILFSALAIKVGVPESNDPLAGYILLYIVILILLFGVIHTLTRRLPAKVNGWASKYWKDDQWWEKDRDKWPW